MSGNARVARLATRAEEALQACKWEETNVQCVLCHSQPRWPLAELLTDGSLEALLAQVPVFARVAHRALLAVLSGAPGLASRSYRDSLTVRAERWRALRASVITRKPFSPLGPREPLTPGLPRPPAVPGSP